MAHRLADRRRLILGTAATLAWPALVSSASSAQAQGRLAPTPAQTEGPFYPTGLDGDTDADLLRHGARNYGHGQPLWLAGRVTDPAGRAVAGAMVEIWQCDHAGHYRHPGDGNRADPAFQGFGRVTVARDGQYRFRTIRPVAYSGRTPHIHVKLRLGTRELLTTQLYVAGDPGNPSDSLWRRLAPEERAALTRPFVAGSSGLAADFPIVVDA